MPLHVLPRLTVFVIQKGGFEWEIGIKSGKEYRYYIVSE